MEVLGFGAGVGLVSFSRIITPVDSEIQYYLLPNTPVLTSIGFHILVYLLKLGLSVGLSKIGVGGGIIKLIGGFIW